MHAPSAILAGHVLAMSVFFSDSSSAHRLQKACRFRETENGYARLGYPSEEKKIENNKKIIMKCLLKT